MADLDRAGRPRLDPAAGEAETLLGFLDFQRATLAWKCSRLDAAGLRARVGPSSLTLGGLLKHMAYVEDHWFSYFLHANERAAPWDEMEWNAVFTSADDDEPADLRKNWASACDRSRELVADVLATGGLDTLAKRPFGPDATASLRFIVVHMIEEYARHNGHADFLRESVDGERGQ